MVYLKCNLCRGAAVEPVVNRCGHLFCRPCLREDFRRHRHGASRCPACGRRVSPSRLTPIYGQRSWSESGDENGAGCGLDDGCPAGGTDVDMMDIDGAEATDGPPGADLVMMDVDSSGTEGDGRGPGGVGPMDVDGGGGQEEEKKMAHLECHICLDDAEEPVATPCGHVYCCPCLFQWLDGRRRKCPMCKEPVSESTVTLVLPVPEDGGKRGRDGDVRV